MIIREKLEVIKEFYPFAESINPILYDFVSNIPTESVSDRSVESQGLVRWIKKDDLNHKTKELDLLSQWIYYVVTMRFGSKLECREMWGVIYNKGDEVTNHHHGGYRFSFSYYVSAPKGSSPLIFTTSGHKIKPQKGQLIIFDSRLNHYVPKDKSEGRCVIVGNFSNLPK